MPFTSRTKDDPGDVARSIDQQQSVDNDDYLLNAIEGDAFKGGVVRRFIVKSSIPDNTATEIFTISTETNASLNAGAYSCTVKGAVVHSTYPPQSGLTAAARSFMAHFARVIVSDGNGTTSAVSEISETASAANSAGTRDIGTITLSTAETSESVVSVLITVDTTGTGATSASVALVVEVAWYGFYSADTDYIGSAPVIEGS